MIPSLACMSVYDVYPSRFFSHPVVLESFCNRTIANRPTDIRKSRKNIGWVIQSCAKIYVCTFVHSQNVRTNVAQPIFFRLCTCIRVDLLSYDGRSTPTWLDRWKNLDGCCYARKIWLTCWLSWSALQIICNLRDRKKKKKERSSGRVKRKLILSCISIRTYIRTGPCRSKGKAAATHPICLTL